jgi:hypothetical protein
MSTFVVRFSEERPGTCRGRIRHVASGEETAFADEHGLLAFIDRMKFLGTLVRDGADLPDPGPALRPDDDVVPRPARAGRTSPGGHRRPTTDRQPNRTGRGGLS